jgi:GxxExxY protein
MLHPDDLIYRQECYALVGACFAVYKDKGCGFLEAVYRECLAIEFEHLGIPFEREVKLALSYRGKSLQQVYLADFVCYGKIIIEVKAVSALGDEHRAQLLNYLNATGFQLGLLVNFGRYPKLEYERLVHTRRL